MPNGFERGGGYGRRGGLGFGFRGSSPPWPYVGIGRGGLPRHEYYTGGAGGQQGIWAYTQSQYAKDPGSVYYQSPYSANKPASTASEDASSGKEQELAYLKNQAEAISKQLDQIEKRMHDLESEK